jgi:hypothetical protein
VIGENPNNVCKFGAPYNEKSYVYKPQWEHQADSFYNYPGPGAYDLNRSFESKNKRLVNMDSPNSKSKKMKHKVAEAGDYEPNHKLTQLNRFNCVSFAKAKRKDY